MKKGFSLMRLWPAVLLGAVLLGGLAQESVALPEGTRSIAPMLEQVVPGVVNISTRSRVVVRDNPFFSDPFFRRFFEDFPGRLRERETKKSSMP